MRYRLLSAAFGVFVAVTQATTASAAFEWCQDDPPVSIVTPGGQTVTVFVTDHARGRQHLGQLAHASFDYTVEPADVGGHPGTMVHLRDTIPTGAGEPFIVRATLSYGGALQAHADGHSGHPMHLNFFVPVR